MNKAQKIILWVGALILSGIWLFPPWNAVVQPVSVQGYSLRAPTFTMNSHYHFVFGNPEGWTRGVVLEVDWYKLLLSSVPVVILTAAAFVTALAPTEPIPSETDRTNCRSLLEKNESGVPMSKSEAETLAKFAGHNPKR